MAYFQNLMACVFHIIMTAAVILSVLLLIMAVNLANEGSCKCCDYLRCEQNLMYFHTM